MEQTTESDEIISSTLAMAKPDREAFIASILDNPDQSGAFLDAMDTLSSYLSVLRTAGGVKAHQALGVGADRSAAANTLGPIQIEQFDIGESLGSGGFADVYCARQLQPIEREVAIKVLRPGHGDDKIAARFKGEQQALAQLDHPSIAQVFDAGRTDDGRLFFVMEKINGTSITEYCQQNRAPLAQRLKLFLDTCEAVEFAHSHSIVHRDLKPSNVMVTDSAGIAMVKIIDFGIAKEIDQQPLAGGALTQQGEFLGTPQSMSPEQLGARAMNIDRRTDVYALGVLLYELLSDHKPFEGATAEAMLINVWRYACGDIEIPRASQRVLRSNTTYRELARNVKGDLDWIIGKSMAVDPAQRYKSVLALGEDIRRYLRHEPVSAGPPTVYYRASKFFRRNWLVVSAASVVLAALVGGLIQTTIERNRSTEALETLTAVTDFQTQMLSNLNPYALGADLREILQSYEADQPLNFTDVARQVIDNNMLSEAANTVEQSFDAQPEVASRLRQSLAEAYLNLGLRERAIAEFEQAQQLFHQQDADQPDREVDLLRSLANAYDQDGQYERALSLGKESVEKAAALYDETHPLYLDAISELASIHISFANYEQSEQLQTLVVEGYSRLYGAEDLRTLSEKHRYATILHHQERLQESLALRKEIFSARTRLLNPLHDDLIITHIGLGSINQHLGNLTESEYHLREALSRRSQALGDDHPRTLSLYDRLSSVIFDQGRVDEAHDLIQQGLRKFESTSEPDEPRHFLLRSTLASVQTARKQFQEAVTTLEDVYASSVAFQGEEHPETVRYLRNLATAHFKAGNIESAQSLYKQAQPLFLSIWGDDYPGYGLLLLGMAEVHAHQGHFLVALDLVDETEHIYLNRFGSKDHPMVADLLMQRGRHLAANNQSENAGSALSLAAEMYQRLNLTDKADLAKQGILALAAR
ncbi:MAG: tetratricopeptide repeat protein [Lysobacterales bacterium]